MSKNLAQEKINKGPDYILLLVLAVIILLGIVILASVSAPFAQRNFDDTFYFLWHQLIYGLMPGIFLGLILFKINLSFFKKAAPFFFIFNLFLMLLVFLPIIGSHQLGASRWLGVGPFSLQPAELLKLTFIIYLASWLSSKAQKKNTETSQTFFFFLVIVGAVSLLLILQPNVSTLGVIAFVSLAMFFSAKTPWWQCAGLIAAGFLGFFFLLKIAPYRANRLMVFLNPDTDPMGIGYQIKQATIAIGSGGINGLGLGMSMQKLGFLPQSMGDSIFAVFSEETGFIGAFVLIFLFLIFLFRGFRAAKSASDSFSQLTAVGIVSWIVIQTFVNIGAMIGILPLTGIPLPFVSYGGSALIIEMAAMGILLNISKNAQK